MGMLDAIYRATHGRVAPTPVAPPVIGVDPVTGQPVPPNVTVPTPEPLAVPAPKGFGILNALGSLVAPEAGSFWASALKNSLYGAKEGQQKYADEQAAAPLARRAAVTNETLKEQQALQNADALKVGALHDTAIGGSIARLDPDSGKYATVYTPPPVATMPTEQERLIDRWEKTPAGPLKDILERAIRGFQYTPEALAAATEAKIKVKQAVPGKAPGSSRAAGLTPTARARYIADAQAAIDQGADPVKVHARLKQMGVE